MPSGVTVSRRIGLSADASPSGCGDARAAFRAALAAAPWQRSPGSRFVRLRSRRPRTVNGCIRWLPEVAIIPPWSPAGASRPGSPRAGGCSPGSRPPARGSAGAHLDAASSGGADMRLPVDARCVFVRTRRPVADAYARISCPAGPSPGLRDACCVPVPGDEKRGIGPSSRCARGVARVGYISFSRPSSIARSIVR